MPKRYLDVGPMNPTMNPDTLRQKTQRSHQQNQERAYVAASRRSDRSIEARVQSARMASQVHKTRTGKALRVSEEIVMRDEMYEEEDDGLPRSYHVLRPQLRTSSVDMNSRVDAYLASRVTISQMVTATEKDWRENEVNRQFAQCFPSADQNISERWATPRFSIPSLPQGEQAPNRRHSDIQPVNYSAASPSQLGVETRALSPPALTPESTPSPATPRSDVAPVFRTAMSPNPSAHYGSNGSAFTAELPLEARLLMTNFDQRDAFDPATYGQQWDTALDSSFEMPKCANDDEELDPHQGFYLDGLDSMDWDSVSHPNNPADELSWDTFINESAWSNDQHPATGHAFS